MKINNTINIEVNVIKNKKINIKRLILAIALPLIVGGISAFLTRNGTSSFKTIEKPPFAPPSWLFPIAWTILYILMGIASYLVYSNNEIIKVKERDNFLLLYLVQLVFNFFWSIIFFNLKQYVFAFIWLVILWILIFLLITNARKINKLSFYLLIPYLIWVSFAGYLNLGIAILN